MLKICVSAENAADAKLYLAAGADQIAAACGGCALGANADWPVDEIRKFGKISLLMDRLFARDETDLPDRILAQLDPAVIDAVFFSDPMMAAKAARYGLKDRLVYRSGMLAASPQDAAWWLAQGIGGVAVPPLLTREETAAILRRVPGCMVTVHGRFLMSVSRRKLLSAYRDDEQVMFDPAARDLFLREEKRDGKMPVFENGSGTYIYTDFIQTSFRDLALFKEAGAGTFYIESLTLTPAQVTAAIRAIRRVLAGAGPEAEEAEYRKLLAGQELSEGYYGQKTVR